jgi:hypothetical protein
LYADRKLNLSKNLVTNGLYLQGLLCFRTMYCFKLNDYKNQNMKKVFFLAVFILMLIKAASAQSNNQGNLLRAGGNFNEYLNRTAIKNLPNARKAGAVNAFNNEENTKGTRFLFDSWVNGDSVINTQGNYINTATFLFNFDKMTNNVLVTQDKINIMAVAPTGINSFILEDKGRQYIFEHVKAIDSTKFFLALVKNETWYSLYKEFITKFAEANFRNDGLIQTGKEYNEYKDESQYYIVQQGNVTAKLIDLKPKVIKAVFGEKKEKADAYFRQHKDDAVDESFLIGLITYLNQ